MSTLVKCFRRLLSPLALVVLMVGCSPHQQPSERESGDHQATPAPSEPSPVAPTPPPELAPRAEPEPAPEPIAARRPLLAGPPAGPAAYFASKTDVVRLDDSGWTRIWFGEVRDFFAGFDGRIYLRDASGIHRLEDDALWTYVADDDGRLAEIVDVHIGPEHDIWLLEPAPPTGDKWLDRELPPIPTRIAANNTIISWDEREQTGLESFRSMALDGSGRAWFMLGPKLGILNKDAAHWWQRVQSWELGDEEDSVEYGCGDPQAGLVAASKTQLLRITEEGVTGRAVIPSGEPRGVLINGKRQAVVAAGCHLYRYDLDALDQPPVDLGSDGAACDHSLAAFDDQGRVWQLDRGETALVHGDAQTVSIALDKLGPWNVNHIVVVGAGPKLPSGPNVIPKPLPAPPQASPEPEIVEPVGDIPVLRTSGLAHAVDPSEPQMDSPHSFPPVRARERNLGPIEHPPAREFFVITASREPELGAAKSHDVEYETLIWRPSDPFAPEPITAAAIERRPGIVMSDGAREWELQVIAHNDEVEECSCAPDKDEYGTGGPVESGEYMQVRVPRVQYRKLGGSDWSSFGPYATHSCIDDPNEWVSDAHLMAIAGACVLIHKAEVSDYCGYAKTENDIAIQCFGEAEHKSLEQWIAELPSAQIVELRARLAAQLHDRIRSMDPVVGWPHHIEPGDLLFGFDGGKPTLRLLGLVVILDADADADSGAWETGAVEAWAQIPLPSSSSFYPPPEVFELLEHAAKGKVPIGWSRTLAAPGDTLD